MSSMSAAELRQVAASLLEQAQVGDRHPDDHGAGAPGPVLPPRCTANHPTSSRIPRSSAQGPGNTSTAATDASPTRADREATPGKRGTPAARRALRGNTSAPYSRKQPANEKLALPDNLTDLAPRRRQDDLSPDDLPNSVAPQTLMATDAAEPVRSCGLVAFFRPTMGSVSETIDGGASVSLFGCVVGPKLGQRAERQLGPRLQGACRAGRNGRISDSTSILRPGAVVPSRHPHTSPERLMMDIY